MQSSPGLFGEVLDVTLQQIIDPADAVLAGAGHRLDPGERSLLVQLSVGNRGPVDLQMPPDLHLVLVDATGRILPKAPLAVVDYPAHTSSVPANTLVSGWTVYVVPAETEVAHLWWSVRPDLPDRTVSWSFGPA